MAEMMTKQFGHKIVDTGLPLRQIAMQHLGLTKKQVFTQEGKASYVSLCGQKIQVRDILGRLGEQFERSFGDHITPYMTHMKHGTESFIVDPSCRRNQGLFWKNLGGIIIEIRNPDAPPSPYAFDSYDQSLVDFHIDNDGLSKGMTRLEALLDLSNKISDLFESFKAPVKIVA